MTETWTNDNLKWTKSPEDCAFQCTLHQPRCKVRVSIEDLINVFIVSLMSVGHPSLGFVWGKSTYAMPDFCYLKHTISNEDISAHNGIVSVRDPYTVYDTPEL